MGRHSRPDSGDSAPEPSDEYTAEHEEQGPEVDDYPGLDLPPDSSGADQFGTEVGHDGGEGRYPADGDHAAPGDYAAPGADDYPDFGWRPADAEASSEAPSEQQPATPPPPQFRGGHRETSDWQGGHRSKSGRRRPDHRGCRRRRRDRVAILR
jgi:hypothetical protein